MQITIGSYLPDGTLAKQSVLSFREKNQYFFYPKFDRFMTREIDWYSHYDLAKSTARHFRLSDHSLFKAGKMSAGYWKSDQLVSSFTFDRFEPFLQYDAALFIERIEGRTIQFNDCHLLRNSLLTPYIETTYLHYLPISSQKILGFTYEDYGIIAGKYHISNGKRFRTYEITAIDV